MKCNEREILAILQLIYLIPEEDLSILNFCLQQYEKPHDCRE